MLDIFVVIPLLAILGIGYLFIVQRKKMVSLKKEAIETRGLAEDHEKTIAGLQAEISAMGA